MSSALAAASLILKPEGYSEGTLESLKPIDRSGDFTFTRGSNLSATRVNSTGLIEKGRENLLFQSNQFDTTWTTSASDLTSNQTGYDGTSDAWLLTAAIPSVFSSRINQVLSPSASGVLNFSVYAKANTLDWILLDGLGTNGFAAWFDIRNGVKGQVISTSIGSKITSVGNGWYRCEVFGNATTLTEVRIYVTDNNGTTTANDGDGCYIQDAQLEVGMVATDYIETAASTVKAGILENTPRLDYSGGATEPSLLLEPSRTNLITQSEYFDASDWSKQNSIGVNTNSDLSPEGLQNATELDGFDSSNFQSVTQYITLSDGTYTFSVFLKKTTGSLNHYPAVVMGSTYKYVIVNSSTGTYAEATGTNNNDSVIIESWDENWWRVIVTNTITAGSYRFAIYPALSSNGTGITINAAGTNVFYGAQVEQGSYPTSYIPNHSGGSVTREVDDIARINNASTNGLLNNYNTTFLFEGSTFKKQQSSNTRFVTLLDAAIASNPRILLFTSNLTSTHSLLLQYRVSGETDVTLATGSTFSYGDNFKAAVTISGTSLSLFVDGVKIGEETIVQGDDIEVIDLAGLATDMSHNAKQFVIFPTALSDADCITLTTL